jgi:hypothetical protein
MDNTDGAPLPPGFPQPTPVSANTRSVETRSLARGVGGMGRVE